MGLSYTGKSCLDITFVTGASRVPDPPARISPLTFVALVRVVRRQHGIRQPQLPSLHLRDTISLSGEDPFQSSVAGASPTLFETVTNLWLSEYHARPGPR